MGENVNNLRANIFGITALLIMTIAAGLLLYFQFTE